MSEEDLLFVCRITAYALIAFNVVRNFQNKKYKLALSWGLLLLLIAYSLLSRLVHDAQAEDAIECKTKTENTPLVPLNLDCDPRQCEARLIDALWRNDEVDKVCENRQRIIESQHEQIDAYQKQILNLLTETRRLRARIINKELGQTK